MGKRSKKAEGNCDSCVNYVFDEDCQYYVCEASLDEDDMGKFLMGMEFQCPFYRVDDEYQVVRHQM